MTLSVSPEERAFIDAVVADPHDDGPRLVYADWLEERGDPRAEWLRLERRSFGTDRGPDDLAVKDRRALLRSKLDHDWLVGLGDSLCYYQAVFEFLDESPVNCSAAQEKIEQSEREAGVRVPASIRELACLQDVTSILFDASDQHFRDATSLDLDFAKSGHLHVASENQGVVEFYARLDGSADPPVDDDNNATWEVDPVAINWCEVVSSFSDFVFLTVVQAHFRTRVLD